MYKKLFKYLEFRVLWESEEAIGFESSNGISVFFLEADVGKDNSRDGNGLNHLAITVGRANDVDVFVREFLVAEGIECLFDTPQRREDFEDEESGYYQVMFEMPGGILFEVVSHEKVN